MERAHSLAVFIIDLLIAKLRLLPCGRYAPFINGDSRRDNQHASARPWKLVTPGLFPQLHEVSACRNIALGSFVVNRPQFEFAHGHCPTADFDLFTCYPLKERARARVRFFFPRPTGRIA